MGVVLLVLGIVFFFKNPPASTSAASSAVDNNSSFNATGDDFVGALSREAEALLYRRRRGPRGRITHNSFIPLIAVGGVLLLVGMGYVIWTLYTRGVNYAAWAAANPGPARIFEAKGGYDGVMWVSKTVAEARAARFANGGGGETTQLIVVSSANENAPAAQLKHTADEATLDALPYAPYPLFGAPAAGVVEYDLTADGGAVERAPGFTY
jgi:hypothetical protein